MLRLIIAKYYLGLLDNNNDSPIWWTCTYSYFLIYPLFFGFSLIAFRLLERFNIITRDNWLPEALTHITASILFIIIFYFYIVRKGHLERIVNKYAEKKINNYLLNFLFFALPFFTFCIGPIITILLFGGSIMKWDFVGALTPYLPE